MKRPKLREIPLPNPFPTPGAFFITIDPGAWDALTKAAYEDGWILLEIEDGKAVRAYQREEGLSA